MGYPQQTIQRRDFVLVTVTLIKLFLTHKMETGLIALCLGITLVHVAFFCPVTAKCHINTFDNQFCSIYGKISIPILHLYPLS